MDLELWLSRRLSF